MGVPDVVGWHLIGPAWVQEQISEAVAKIGMDATGISAAEIRVHDIVGAGAGMHGIVAAYCGVRYCRNGRKCGDRDKAGAEIGAHGIVEVGIGVNGFVGTEKG